MQVFVEKNKIYYVVTTVLLVFFWTSAAICKEAPIQIAANKMTSVEKSRSVIFTGDVDAKQGDVRIRSDKMTVYYTEKATVGQKAAEDTKQQVEKLVCVGNVEITRGEWLGTGKKMTYLQKKRQVILSGKAKAWQGQNMVSGEKIIYYMDEGRSEVVGGTATTIAGSKKKKKKPSRVNMTILQN